MKKTKDATKNHLRHSRRASSRFSLTRVLKNVFVPNKQNSYRPHLTRSWVLLVVLAAFVAGQISTGLLHKSRGVLADNDSLPPVLLLQDTNNIRSREGVQPLSLNHQLTEAATAKVNDMFVHQYWNHVSPNGVQPWFWIVQSGYTYQAAGENLAKNFYTADATVQAWYDSPTHRENMLNQSYSEVGFATASGMLNGKHATITVAMYGEPTVLGAMTIVNAPKAAAPDDTFLSAGVDGKLSLADRVGLAVQSMPPLVIGVVVLLGMMVVVLLLAHSARHELPRSHVRHHLRHNHALIKGVGVFVFIVSIFWLYGGGQI